MCLKEYFTTIASQNHDTENVDITLLADELNVCQWVCCTTTTKML